MDIRTKLVFALVAVALGSMTALGVFAYQAAGEKLRDSQRDRFGHRVEQAHRLDAQSEQFGVAHPTLEVWLNLGRVTSGAGGEVIIDTALKVVKDEFTDLADRLRMLSPDEKFKRHGQAIAAASLPSLDHEL